MIPCPNCHHLNLDGNRFCHYCGKPLNPRKSMSSAGRRKIPSGEKHRVHAGKKVPLLWLLLVLVVVSVSALYMVTSKSQTAGVSMEREKAQANEPVLLIQKFKFSPGSETAQRTGEALALAIGEKLFSSRKIRIPSDFESGILKDGNTFTYQEKSPLVYHLSGNIEQTEDTIQVKARVEDFQGSVRLDFGLSVEDESLLIGAAEAIARRVIDSLTPRILGGNDNLLRDMTTAEWPAWLDYTKGKRFFYAGRWDESSLYFKESVLKDPGFALGYQALAETAALCGQPENAWMLGQKALGWIDRLSPRRRLQLQADTYLKSEKYIPEAHNQYQEILQAYPWDARAHYFSSVLAAQKENRPLDIERSDVPFVWRALALSSLPVSEWMLGDCKQMPAESGEVSVGGYYISALCSLINGQNMIAMEYAEAGSALSPAGIFDRLKGDIHWLQGQFEEAETEYERGLEDLDPAEQIWRGYRLGQAALTRGYFQEVRTRWTETIKKAEKLGLRSWAYQLLCSLARLEISRNRYQSAMSLSQQAMNIAAREDARVFPYEGLLWRGLAQAGLKQWSDVDQTLSELEDLCSRSRDVYNMCYYHYLNGVIKAAGNIFDKALEDFQQAASLLPRQGKPFDLDNNQAFFLNGLAEAMEQAGRMQEAIDVYARLERLTTGRMDYGDIWALSHYQQGRLFDKMQRKEKAEEKYRIFLNYWANADSETWEKDEARRRLNEMTS